MLTTLIILIIALSLLLSDRLRPDLVSLLVIVSLGVTGVLTPTEAFSGFSRSAVVTIFAIFILAEGLQCTGVTEQVGELLLRVGGKGETRLVTIVMAAGAFLSLFMNNIAAASVLLPAVSGVARKSNVNPSRLLMPLAFGTILGGAATLFTTSNIVISSFLRDAGLNGFGVLDFVTLGVPIAVVGIAYIALWGRHLLPVQSTAERFQALRQTDDDLVDVYRLGERLFRAKVPQGSILTRLPLAETPLRHQYHVNVVAIERKGLPILDPGPSTVCQVGDILTLQGDEADFRQRDVEPYLEIQPRRDWREEDLESPEVVVLEVILTPRSRLIGQTLADVGFRDKYGMAVLAIWRAGSPITMDLAQQPLEFGDALLLQGPRARLPLLRRDSDFIVFSEPPAETVQLRDKAWLAMAIMLGAIIIAAVGWVSTAEIMLAGALVMILAGILTMDQVYRAAEWKSIFLIAGLLPLGLALTKTGAAALLATHLITLLGPWGPYALLAGLFVFTTLLTQAMSGQAVGAVVAPIAIQTAQQIGVDPRAMAMGVAMATSMAFMTPLAHSVNILVMGAGGYRFRDYFRIGWPLSVILFVVVMALMPVFWPLMPRQ